jgi:AraC family transcriptional regulator, regulatory protein of adaptative response / methylphosphotriester-DNA alkyltransferase methyltransferase
MFACADRLEVGRSPTIARFAAPFAGAVQTSASAPTRSMRRFRLIPSGDAGVWRNVPTQRPATVRLRTSLFEESVRIVEEEYASDLTLDDIAHRVASSRRQLQRAYAEIGRTTFRDHLTGVRMDRAADMLHSERLSVREVAARVGYRQPAQFAKAFRRHIGLSPSEYRLTGRVSANGGDPLARAA